jgi:tetratricopeptide (TPR) repeat protein
VKRSVLVAVLSVCVLSGCFGHARLVRMTSEMESDLRRHDSEQIAEMEDRYLRTASEIYEEGTVEWVNARSELVGKYVQWGLMDRATAIAAQSVAIAKAQPPEGQSLARALIDLGIVQTHARRWEDAERTIDQVVEFCRTAPVHVPTDLDPYDECFFVQYDIPGAYLEAGNYRKFAHEYLRSRQRNGRSDRATAILEMSVLGRGYARYGAYPEAIWYFQGCVDEAAPRSASSTSDERLEWASPSGDVEVVTMDSAHSFESQAPRCFEDLIEMRRMVGEAAEADRLSERQTAMWSKGPDLEQSLRERVRKTHSIWHDGYLTSHYANGLAFYLAGKGRHEDAINAYRQAIAYIDEGFAKDGVFHGAFPAGLLVDELLGLGESCEATGRFDEAAKAYDRAVTISDQKLHPSVRYRLDSRAGLARSLEKARRSAESEAAWRSYLRNAETIRGRDHADYAFGLTGLASALEANGRGTQARQLSREAEAIRAVYARKIASVRELPLPVALRSTPPPAN